MTVFSFNNPRRSCFIAMFVTALVVALTIAPTPFTKAQAQVAQTSTQHPLPSGTVHTRPARSFDVQHYLIRTRFDAARKTIYGDTTITLKPLAPNFRSFALDAANLNIDSVTFGDTNAALHWSTQTPEKLSLTLERDYQPSDSISVRIQYHATPQRGLYFIAQSPANSVQSAKPAQIWTQGEPEDNHYWFPCYDFPDDKATSEQFITTAKDQLAIANGALLETKDNADNTRTFHYRMDKPHSTYLISLIVGDYAKLTDTYKSTALEYYTYRGTEETARRVFARTPLMIETFNRKLNYDYPYNKYAQSIVAGFIFGGMENITATTHSDMEILHPAGDALQAASDNLISHELAHQWFGDLVTCKDWSQAWLNEGFATFMEAVFKENLNGRGAYLAELREDARTYLREDATRYRRPLVYNRYREPINLFDATLYQKGALVLHMLREVVGDELFWKSLNRYLVENQYKNVETLDLQRAFEQTTHQSLSWFFDQWVYQAGFPELRVRSAYDPATRNLTLTIQQTQTSDDFTPAVFRLPLDVELVTAKTTRTEHINITQREQRFVFQLDGAPSAIHFDKNDTILKKLDFPPLQHTHHKRISTNNLRYRIHSKRRR